MNPTTASILFGVKSDLDTIREKMDVYMHGGEKPLPDEDLAYCLAVYNSISKTLDLL